MWPRYFKINLFLLKLFYRKLWVKTALILVLLVTISMAALGALLINTSQNAIRKSVLNNHKEIALRSAEEVELFIKNPRDLLKSTAAMLGVIFPAPWKQETVLTELVLNQPIFIQIASFDLSGEELANSELGRKINWPYFNEALEAARANKDYASKVTISDNHTPYLTISVPVRKMGKAVGALIADITLRGVWDIVDNIKIEKTGRAFLISDDGTLIAHQDKKKVLKNENLGNLAYIKSALKGGVNAVELEDEKGVRSIVSYAPIHDLGWAFVLTQEQKEAYLFSKVMQAQSWMIILLSELIAIIAALVLAKLFVRPLSALAVRAKKIADGDLDQKIEIKRKDEIGRLVRSFNDMTKKLKRARSRERLSAIGEAASWIAHELKNSTVAIKAFVQLFPKKHRDKEFVNRFSKLIPEEMMRWEHLLKQLSDFSSNNDLNIETLDLNSVLGNVLGIMKDHFSEQRIDVRYGLKEGPIYVQADPEKIKQVLMNIIINSANAMPEGGELMISAVPGPLFVEVRIIDTGRGIPLDALEKIFEPFYTAGKGGMGLGLTISQKIIEQHGGSIDIKSEPSSGTTATIRLPVEIKKKVDLG
ncbi:MAG: ATP-binding protein [Candidatus Omnitrophota bacterium]